jgi:hypothetical protein
MRPEVDELLAGFRPMSLAELDERAALLRRVDHKYVLEWDAFEALARRLQEDHEALEIDGGRHFGYESMYFDTAGLRCFRDHVEERRPRFKARTRCYRDSGACSFEVKLKTADDETDKRQLEHPPERRDRLTREAERFLAESVSDVGLDLDGRLEPSLRTEFRRMTLASPNASARLTCDLDVRLSRPGDGSRSLKGDLVLLESKSEDGEAAADRMLAEMGVEPISLSKYKVGIELLTEQGGRAERDPSARFFA